MTSLETPRSQRIGNVTAENHSTALVGTFGNVNISHNQTLFDSLPFVANAEFDSATKQDDSPCLHDTRTEVLKSIRAWAYSDEVSCIFWLSGKAGTGKSTIALTIAREFSNRNELGASFFFVRGGGDAAHAGKFFTSIARQLAIKWPAVQPHIAEELRKEPDIATKTRQDQWKRLIVEPLNKIDLQSSVLVIVVDALDECDREEDIVGIITLFAKASEIQKCRLRIIVTSRPETAIRAEFRSPEIHHRPLVLENQPQDVVDADICLYYYDAFDKIKRRKPRIPRNWPDIDTVNRLVCSTGGLFIFAATVCRFISRSRTSADTSIQAFLCNELSAVSSTSHDETGSIWAIDRTYSYILGQSISHHLNSDSQLKTITEFQDILGTVAALAEPLPVNALACLLAKPEDVIYDYLEELHSVVCVPELTDEPIHLFHASFRDFLLDPRRCRAAHFTNGKEIQIPVSLQRQQIHSQIAVACLKFLSEPGRLRRDMCSVGKPGTPRRNITDESIRYSIPPATAYACRYWVYHIEQSRNGERIEDSGLIQNFLNEHFLHWIETSSWLGHGSECVHQIGTLQLLTKQNSQLSSFLDDASRFMLRNLFVVDLDPLQLYCSALVFSPQQSVFRRQFADEMLVRFTGRLCVPETWGPEIHTLEGQPDHVHKLAFSLDGQLIASVSTEQTPTSHVMVWSAVTGQLVQHLHICGYVHNISFSSERLLVMILANVVETQTWDVLTGQKIQQVRRSEYGSYSYVTGHSRYFELAAYKSRDESTTVVLNVTTGEHLQMFGRPNRVMAISDDGQLIASACDETVQLWSVKPGRLEEKLRLHLRLCESIDFSPDGRFMAVFNRGGALKLLDVVTGKWLQKFRGYYHYELYDRVVKFSHNGRLLVIRGSNEMQIWSTDTGEQLNQFEVYPGSYKEMAISPDGRFVACASVGYTVRVWSLATDEQVHSTTWDESKSTEEIYPRTVVAIAFSPPDGGLVASTDGTLGVRLWDSATGLQLRHVAKGTGPITSVVFLPPDGQRIAAASQDRTIYLWETASGMELLRIKNDLPHDVVAFSPPDGKMMASGSRSGRVTIWDLEANLRVHDLFHKAHRPSALAFSVPDGGLLVSACADCPEKSIVIWSVVTGEMMRSWKLSDYIYWMVFSSDGNWLETDTGRLDLTSSETSILSLTPARDGVRLHGRWIRLDGRDTIWLPPEYHAASVAIHENAIALGHENGTISIMRFMPLEE